MFEYAQKKARTKLIYLSSQALYFLKYPVKTSNARAEARALLFYSLVLNCFAFCRENAR